MKSSRKGDAAASSQSSRTCSIGLSPEPIKEPENMHIVQRKHKNVESAIGKRILTEKKVVPEQSLELDQIRTIGISSIRPS